ncbi:MAG TPA: hypothetical protein PKD09_07930 [Aggregatilinea sp.]|uniref:hypothetical protein n=1 Tax=Aggregatilinea sp. TaxID=2806333 RepID=UPI002B5F84A3|nr:hypothetical protein [Aggregatilinea sp.]HML21559.1 hypothetical protein [Aggregatilinea sp.]
MNVFFLIAALLLFLLVVAHTIWGEKMLFGPLKAQAALDGEQFVSLYVPWHQGTYLLLLCGVAMVWAAIDDSITELPWAVLAVAAGNLMVFLALSVMQGQMDLIKNSVPQTVLFLVLIALLLAGIAA